MKKSNRKNNLDEMQEQKLLHIEHNGCWFAFWALLASLIIQTVLSDGAEMARYMAGEWIVFMCLSFYLGFACMKNGIWDRRFKADAPTNIMFSLAAGIVVFIVMAVVIYKRSGMIVGSVAAGAIMGGFTFAICVVSMFVCTMIYKKRVETLESDDETEE